jgi:hypothetical protein
LFLLTCLIGNASALNSERDSMPLLVTSASGANGDGYGTLLAFDGNGAPLGPFCNDERIADPRGLVVDQHERLLYLNSGQDRVLALDAGGTVVRDTGPIKGLNPGGGNFGPEDRYYVGLRTARTITAFPRTLDAPSEHFLRWESCRFRADLHSVTMGDCFWALGSARWVKATTLLLHSLQTTTCSPRGS